MTETASGRAPVAYAMLPSKRNPGLYYAVELKNVRYEKVKVLEPGGSSERRGGCLARLETSLLRRTIQDEDGGWLTEHMRRGRS